MELQNYAGLSPSALWNCKTMSVSLLMLCGTENYVQDYSLKEDVFYFDEHQRKTTQNEKERQRKKKKNGQLGKTKGKTAENKI